MIKVVLGVLVRAGIVCTGALLRGSALTALTSDNFRKCRL